MGAKRVRTDGNVDTKTRRAIRAFQKRAKLDVTGRFDDATRIALARKAKTEGVRGGLRSQEVLSRASTIGKQINATGGYRFDGKNDCWGFVRRVLDPVLQKRGLGPLPTADYGTAAGNKSWAKVDSWKDVPVGTPLSTHRGHKWGADWHGGIFAGVKNGKPMIWDNSGSGSAQLRPLPNPRYFSYMHTPSARALGT